MNHKKLFLPALFALFISTALALPMDYETASVGRIQGDSLGEISDMLAKESIAINSASYYTDEYMNETLFNSPSKNEAEQTREVLQKTYGGSVYWRSNKNWSFGTISSGPENDLLIIQTPGEIKSGKLATRLGNIENTPLNQLEEVGLAIADVDYAGTYLPTMGKTQSLSSQLAGKTPLIATNGKSNPSLVKAIVCSLALQETNFAEQDPNGYSQYTFDTLGDRLRNAKNNLREFGPGGQASISGDYSLYGAPFLGVTGNKLSQSEAEKLCGNYARYNTFPVIQSISGFVTQSNETVYTKTIYLNFSDYTVSGENGFEFIDVNGTLQELSIGSPALPYAVSEIQFPLGTIIKDVRLASKANPTTITANIPVWSGEGLATNNCAENYADASVEFSQRYTEDRESVIATVKPVEVSDCTNRQYKLYRSIELEIDYVPYSPVLLKEVQAEKEYFPNELADINVVIENITPSPVSGTITIMDGDNTLAETTVSLTAGEMRNEAIPLQIGGEEGFYDYGVKFRQGGEEKTRTNFKAKTGVVKQEVEFAGSKEHYHDFAAEPIDVVWDISMYETRTTGSTPGYTSLGSGENYLQLYAEGSANSAPTYNQNSIGALTLASLPDKRFSINDLPMRVVVSPNSYLEVNESFAGQPNKYFTQISSTYELERVDDTNIRWRKDGGEWTIVDLTSWDRENLGFVVYSSATASYEYTTTKKVRGAATASIQLTDGVLIPSEGSITGNKINLVNENLDQSKIHEPNGYTTSYNAKARLEISEISSYHANSARGNAEILVQFENRGTEKDSESKYIVTDSENNVFSTGGFQKAIPKGASGQQLTIRNFDANKSYELLLETSYENKSKISKLSLSGNNAPQIIAPSYIYADAYDTVTLDYSIVDADNDFLETSVGEPFGSDSEWETTEADFGVHTVTLTASDGITTSEKTVTIEVGPPKIECSVDLDCGSIVTVEPRVCSGNVLLARETHPVCNNPGSYYAYCSTQEVDSPYGSCNFKETFEIGETRKLLKFESAGEQTLHIEVPRKARVRNAFLKIIGEAKTTQCYNAAQTFDTQNSTAIRHNFANGTSFMGLPLGDETLVASGETSSDQLDGFPAINFSYSTRGIASSAAIVPLCIDQGSGFKYLELVTGCDEMGGNTYTPNINSQCTSSPHWVQAGFVQPTSNSGISDYCVWGGGGKEIGVQTNLSTAYNRLMGQFAGIGDNRPAFRAYVRQFQTGKELYLGEIPFNTKTVSFTAEEDLQGQSIDYFITADGANWVPISNNQVFEVPFGDIGKTFNWKAVFNTGHEGITPRIYSTDICISNVGMPDNPRIIVGDTEVFNFTQTNGFDKEIDITDSVNAYLESLPLEDVNISVPVRFETSSGGVIEVSQISYEFDVHENEAPVISEIPDRLARTGGEFGLLVVADDFEGDTITFSDDTELFDINSATGAISFVPKKEDAGIHFITITAFDGSLESSVSFTLTVEHVNSAPVIHSIEGPNSAKEGELVKITVNATDPDGDALSYSMDSNNFVGDGNTFAWQTGFDSGGDYNFTFTVSDGNLSVGASHALSVQNVNAPPQIDSYYPEDAPMVDENTTIEFSVTASDPDNDPLTIKWFLNGVETGEGNAYSLPTDYNSAGSYEARVVVSDGNLSAERVWLATVVDVAFACYSDAECDDSDDYTEDTCLNAGTPQSVCTHEPIACFNDLDCDDGNAYTIDSCSGAGTTDAVCSYTVIECLSDLDCDDGVDYTIDSCVLSGGSGVCVHDEIIHIESKDSLELGETINATVTGSEEPVYYYFDGTFYSSPWKLYRLVGLEWIDVDANSYVEHPCNENTLCENLVDNTIGKACNLQVPAEGCYEALGIKNFGWSQRLYSKISVVYNETERMCIATQNALLGLYKLEFTYYGQDGETCGGEAKTLFKTFQITGEAPAEKVDLGAQKIGYNYSGSDGSYKVAFNTGVRNIGEEASGPFKVEWFIDANQVFETVESLEPNSIRTTAYNKVFVLSSGDHEVRIMVDTQGAVGESNESNNERAITVNLP